MSLSVIQGDHQICYSESPCQQPGYVPQRMPLTMQAAISAYEATLRTTLIYKKRLGQPQRLQAGIQWYTQPQPSIDECVGMWLITGTKMSRNVADSDLCMSVYVHVLARLLIALLYITCVTCLTNSFC